MKRISTCLGLATLATLLTLGTITPSSARERHRVPPMNVAGEDMNALVGGTVFVGHYGALNRPGNPEYRRLLVIYIGGDYRRVRNDTLSVLSITVSRSTE